jgi:uncharacterized protein YegL
MSTREYKQQANAEHPATIIYLVDISGSMQASMPGGKTRIEVVKDAIQVSYAAMLKWSTKQGKVRPRYRIGMIAYESDLYDVYDGILTLDKVIDQGIPNLMPQRKTEMAKAFRYASKLIQDDLSKWPQKWLDECPPPMVINITDCEYSEETEDPEVFARKLQEISVADGNVLVENIFVTDQIVLSNTDVKEWKGYKFNESTDDAYGDKLLAMSSPLPASFAEIMNEQAGLKLRAGTAMMFPGINKEFITTAFVVGTATGSQIKNAPLRPQTWVEHD